MNDKTKKCVPCEGGVPKLDKDSITTKLTSLKGWGLDDNKIKKLYKFKDFKESLNFVNRVGELAESEGHHPDIFLAYGKAEITLWTHSIAGLSENDFILAEKIESI